MRIAVYRAAAINRILKLIGLYNVHPYPALPPNVKISTFQSHLTEYELLTRLLPAPTINDAELVKEWQITARAKLAALMGVDQVRDRPSVTAFVQRPNPAENISRYTAYLRVRPNCDISVHLLLHQKIDLKKKLPIFVYLAGSTSGIHLAWGEAKVPIDHDRLSKDCAIGLQAAERGYLVLCIEQLGFGERAERMLNPRSASRTLDAHAHALLLGRCLMGEKVLDVMSSLDWLTSSEFTATTNLQINFESIFAYGHSSGGSAALYATALDVRIQGLLASGCIGQIRDTIAARRSPDGDSIIPGILRFFEMSDIIALIAPRRFVGLSGDQDHIFPYAGAEECIRAAQNSYQALDAWDSPVAIKVNGPHQYYAADSWRAWDTIIHPERLQKD